MPRTETPERTFPPQAAQEPLDVFVGKWRMEGRADDSPFGPAAVVSADQTYEWLPGRRFLVHRLHGRLGDGEMACIEVFGPAKSRDGYVVHSFYNDGRQNEWQAVMRGGEWTIRGEWVHEGRPLQVRCTGTFGDGGRTLTCVWEFSEGGSGWRWFWSTRAVRA